MDEKEKATLLARIEKLERQVRMLSLENAITTDLLEAFSIEQDGVSFRLDLIRSRLERLECDF